MKLKQLKRNKKLLAVVGLGLVVFLYVRSRSSSPAASTTIDPNAIDPATGLSYGAEQQAALAGGGGGGTSGTDASTATAAALEGLASGLTDLQTAQAQDEANLQDVSDTAAQLVEAFNAITTLGVTPKTDPTASGPPSWAGKGAGIAYVRSLGLFRSVGTTAAGAAPVAAPAPARSLSLVTQPTNSPTPRASSPEISAPVFVRRTPVASPSAVASAQAVSIPRGSAVAV